MATMHDLVEFSIAHERYAMDIQLAREIVEMVPLTPIPRAPSHVSGIINLRGEITTIVDLAHVLEVDSAAKDRKRKIIILVPEHCGGSHVGITVDDVDSVIQVTEKDVEKLSEGFQGGITSFVKGVIKKDGTGEGTGLILWIDLEKILHERIAQN